MELTPLLIFTAFVAQGVTSLKCNEGFYGIHGFPLVIEPSECEAGVVNCAKIRGTIEVESVQVWSCGLKTDQSSCISGVPDGVQLDVGETVDGAITCFCTGDLCNGEHFCDTCVVTNSTSTATTTTTTTTISTTTTQGVTRLKCNE